MNGSPKKDDLTGSDSLPAPQDEPQGHERAPGVAKSLPGHDEDGPPHESNRLVYKIKLLNRFVDKTIVGLDCFTSLLWVVLYREARDGFAALSHEQIATKMGVSARTVARHIDILIANRLLRKVKTGGFGRGCNRYQLGIEDKSADNPLRRLPRVKKRDSPAEPNPPTRRKPK